MIDVSPIPVDHSSVDLKTVFEKRPLLQTIFESHKDHALINFVQSNIQNMALPSAKRQDEFLGSLQKILLERFPTQTAEEIIAQLKKYYGGSSADHHGILNSNLAISSNFLMAAGFQAMKDPLLKYLFVLSCSSVSLNNDDFPQGILFHRQNGEEFVPDRLSLLPSNSHSCVVYGFRAYKKEEVEKIKKFIRQRVREGIYSQEVGDKLMQLVEALLEKTDIMGAPDLCNQFTRINFLLWKMMFQNSQNVPDLVHVELEEIASRLIIEHHLDQESPVHQLIFSADWQKEIVQPLTDIMEKYLRQGNLATDLFWGISSKHKRVKLIRSETELRSEDGEIVVSLQPDALREALKNRTIMPNLLVAYFVVHLYYGMNCFGGFNQIHYLDAMKKFYLQKNIDADAPNANSTLYQFGLDLVSLKEVGGKRFPATGFDFCLYRDASWEDLLQKTGQISFGEAFYSSANIIQELI